MTLPHNSWVESKLRKKRGGKMQSKLLLEEIELNPMIISFSLFLNLSQLLISIKVEITVPVVTNKTLDITQTQKKISTIR